MLATGLVQMQLGRHPLTASWGSLTVINLSASATILGDHLTPAHLKYALFDLDQARSASYTASKHNSMDNINAVY